ncbi:hypothetical protein ACNOYE_02225 [Nannocystaceae bacterium ST9]
MTDLPANASSPGEPSQALVPGPRMIHRLPEPESPTMWIAGPLTAASARQTGVSVGCAVSFAGRRSELAAFLEQVDVAVGKRRSDEAILGGAPPGRRRAGPVAPVMVR